MSDTRQALGDVSGIEIVDVACGTGRASMHLAKRGARVTGLDFAPKTSTRRAPSEGAGLSIEFRVHDALMAPPADLVERFDLGITISCLAMACSEAAVFDHALGHIVSLVRPGGRFLFPRAIHRSRLLRRISA